MRARNFAWRLLCSRRSLLARRRFRTRPLQITAENEARASDPFVQPFVELVPVNEVFPFVFELGLGFFLLDSPSRGAPPGRSEGVLVYGLVADRKDFRKAFFFAALRRRSTNVDLTSDRDSLVV